MQSFVVPASGARKVTQQKTAVRKPEDNEGLHIRLPDWSNPEAGLALSPLNSQGLRSF